jgi:HTH-type transcriptional regulator, cell division transcriptional repressor
MDGEEAMDAAAEVGLTDETGDTVVDWYSEEAATFGDRLAGARENATMTQKELASRLGVKLSTLRSWEDDLNEPRANKLQMVAGLLGVSLTWLLTGRGDGLESPDVQQTVPEDVTLLLSEMRALRTQVAQAGERLGQLEKRLRAAIRKMA